jgi:hypothetical protein
MQTHVDTHMEAIVFFETMPFKKAGDIILKQYQKLVFAKISMWFYLPEIKCIFLKIPEHSALSKICHVPPA